MNRLRTMETHRYLWLVLGAILFLAGCSSGPAKPTGDRAIGVSPTFIGAREDARLIVRIAVPGDTAGFRTQALTFDHAEVRLSGPLLANPPRTATVPFAQFSPAPSPSPSMATAVIQNLRPGTGYKLEVSLYDAATPNNHVLASGETSTAFSLTAGTNTITVSLTETSVVTLTQPLPLTFSSLFNNATPNAYGFTLSTVVVQGDVLKILPGVNDPNNQLREIKLWLDGTAGANFTDGKLLARWFPGAFKTVFTWPTGTTVAPVFLGTSNEPAGAATPSPVPPPSAAPAESPSPNHTLTFTLHDRLAPSTNDLIGVVTYNLTVLQAASANVGIQAGPTVIANIPVGTSPSGIAVNPNTNRAYVTNSSGNNVSVIDTVLNAVIATVSVGPMPIVVGVNTSTNRVYVVNAGGAVDDSISVIDGTPASGTENTVIATITTTGGIMDNERGIAVNPVTNKIYVPSFHFGGSVFVIDGSSNTITITLSTSTNPFSAAVNTVTNKIYVGHGTSGGNNIEVINGATNAVSTGAAVGKRQAGLGVVAATNRLYVYKGDPPNGEPFGVVVVDTSNDSVVTTITSGIGPGEGFIGVNANTNRVYATNSGTTTVSIIDIASGSSTLNTVVDTVVLAGAPGQVAVNPSTNRIYVSVSSLNKVAVIEDLGL